MANPSKLRQTYRFRIDAHAISFVCFVLVSCSTNHVIAQPEVHGIEADESAARHFTLKVLPVLKSKCFACHGDKLDEIEGELNLTTRAGMVAGGEAWGTALTPKDPEASPLFQAMTWSDADLEMPPKENDRLTENQIADVRRWIEAGAPWPDADAQKRYREEAWNQRETEDGILVATSGGLADEWTYRRYQSTEIWAFQPLRTQFKHSSIDGFIQGKLDGAGVVSAPQAEPQLLLRRAYLDLIGIPPTPREQQEFLAAWQENQESAWHGLIERLLESPHYGERWAQHWLDVARYADTGGLSNDYERSNAWRYRDYVIRSFNSDKPYDQFVIEQIAGDEWANTLDQNDEPSHSRAIEARLGTAFLRMGPWETAMIPQEEARQLFRDDVVDSIGRSFLSMPMRCCKCHDHKFDPVPTRDYYRMYAAVSASQPAEMPADFLETENLHGSEQGAEDVSALHEFSDVRRIELVEKRENAAKQWYAEHNLPYKDEEARRNDPEDQKPPRHVGLDEDEKGRLKVREQDCWVWNRRLERYQPLVHSVFNGPDQDQNARKLRPPQEIDPEWRPKSYIFMGGDRTALGEPVTPGVLSGCNLPVAGAPSDDPFALPIDVNGRRLALAKWIANKDNPLTARSYVNRIWQHHFGHGIVRTPNNFGVKGDKPSHPELLDWLTQQFIRGGWQTKPLHRLIMQSSVYRRSTSHPNNDALMNIDPDNKLLAKFSARRLSAEELRDSLLAATGELNRQIGGLPAFPEINMEVALQPRMIQFSIAPAYLPSKTRQERNRRSIYAYRCRGLADPFMEVLNKPTPNDSCARRDTAAVSPQAFTLLNSEILSDRSVAMARRIQEDADEVGEQLIRAFTLILGREPSAKEHQSLLAYVEEMVAYHREHTPKGPEYPTEITRSLVEEFSGQPFEYTEWLPAFEDYEPDTKPADVNAKTRALADMCLVLFNTNEFIYVY